MCRAVMPSSCGAQKMGGKGVLGVGGGVSRWAWEALLWVPCMHIDLAES
jgi:hypothetical protein